ncbi:hypothetical protein CHUAL_002364 [Chamberlinius hualienensis]
MNIRPWESADGADLVYDASEHVQSDSEDTDEANGRMSGGHCFLRPSPKPRKALSEGSWPIFFAQSDSEGWLNSSDAQVRLTTGTDDTKQQLVMVETNVCSSKKYTPEAANVAISKNVMINHDAAAIVERMHGAAMYNRAVLSSKNKGPEANISDTHPEVDSVWKRKIQRFANTVQLSVNSSSTPGSSGSSPCLSMDELEDGTSVGSVSAATIKVPILSNLVRAEMEQRAAAQKKFLDKSSLSRNFGHIDASVKPVLNQFHQVVIASTHPVSLPSEESLDDKIDYDDDKECDDVFVDNNTYNSIILGETLRRSDRSSSDELSPIDITGRLIHPRESRGSSTSHSESVATVIERSLTAPSGRLLMRSSASTLSSMESDSSTGAGGGGCGATGVIGESIEELEDEQIESTSGSSGTSGVSSVGTSWQVTEEGCFYLPEVNTTSVNNNEVTEEKLLDVAKNINNKLEEMDSSRPVVVIEVTEDGTRRVISSDDYDSMANNSINKSKTKDGSSNISLSDHSGTENGDTTSQSSLETVMTVLERKKEKVKPPVPPKPAFATLRKTSTPPIPPPKPTCTKPPIKVHETGGYVLLSLQSFSQDDDDCEAADIQEKVSPVAHNKNKTISATSGTVLPVKSEINVGKNHLSLSNKVKIEVKDEGCSTEKISDDVGGEGEDESEEEEDDCDSKTLTPDAGLVSNSDIDTTASSFTCPRYYSVHASTQTEILGAVHVKKKVRRCHTIANPSPHKPSCDSQSTMTSSMQTDMEESGGTLDDLPSIVSDEVGPQEEDLDNPNVNRGDSPLLLRKTDSFHSMSSSGSSSALGGSSDGFGGGGGSFQTPDHTLTDISDIPSHYANLDLDTVQVTIPDTETDGHQQQVEVPQRLPEDVNLHPVVVDNSRLNSGNITPSTTPSPLLSPISPSRLTSFSTSGYEELKTENSRELSDLRMKELEILSFSDKDHSQSCSEDSTSKTLCPSPRSNHSDNKVHGSSTSDVDTDETLGNHESSADHSPAVHKIPSSTVGSELLPVDHQEEQNRSTSPILLTVEDSSAPYDKRRTPSLTIVRSGSGNSGSSGGSPLLEFEVEVLVDELFRDFGKTMEDACRSGSKSPTPPPSLSVTDGKLSTSDLDIANRCSSASPKPPASPIKRTKLFSISMVQRSRDSSSPSRESEGQRLTVKSHQQRHSFDLTLATSSNTSEFLSTSNIATSKRYHSLELPTQTTIEITPDITSPVAIISTCDSEVVKPSSEIKPEIEIQNVEKNTRDSSPVRTIVYQPIVHEPGLVELMDKVTKHGHRGKEIGWQRIESIPSELYYITTVEDVSEDFETCIITTPEALETSAGASIDISSKSESKSEKSAVLTSKSKETKQITDGTLLVPRPIYKAFGGKTGVWSPGSSPASSVSSIKVISPTRDIPQDSVEKNGSVIPLSPVWKPPCSVNSQDATKQQYKSVKLDASLTLPSKVQENGVNNVYPPPAPFANSSTTSPEENVNVNRGDRNPPAVPPKSLSLKRSTNSEINQPIYANVNFNPDASPPPFTRVNPAGSGLPPSQNPTVTLLQKAREGQIPKKAVYIDHKMNSKDYHYDPWIIDQYTVKTKKPLDSEPVKYESIGPTAKGVPMGLCSDEGVKDEHKGEWYKRMYKSLQRTMEPEGRPYLGRGGYMSEPEPERNVHVSTEDYGGRRYGTLDRRKNKNDYYVYDVGSGSQSKKQSNMWNPPSARCSSEVYKNQPKRIEDYEPGRSSIAEMEAKMFWSEVIGVFSMDDNHDQQPENRQSDVPLYRPPEQSFLLKDGYESDSTLVYHKRGPPENLSPAEQRAWYREFQKGGDIPLTGFRRPAPERPDESPHRYRDGQVNIHYRSPVRNMEKEYICDEEIRRKQEVMMKQFYEEERRKKAIQELLDIESRRHTDNFVPSQKSPIPLDRYDNLYEDSPISPMRTPEPRLAGRALHNFRALNARELSFNKGDIVIIHRKIDKNWYEGEHHGIIGIFPVNHIEVIPFESARTTKKSVEGQGRVKYNFQAQTSLELSLVKGETVILMRKVDQNWYDGRIGSLRGIFPASYIDVLLEPSNQAGGQQLGTSKPVTSSASHSLIKNGSHISKRHPEMDFNQSNYYNQHPSNNIAESVRRYGSSNKSTTERLFEDRKLPLDQTLHIQTQNEPLRYRAIYNYKPQNDDELELHDGDLVYVMEKCDDGWYVGSSQRTGLFGTFPGNYVERI